MNKKLLNRFLVTTLSLASSVCVVGGVKASAVPGRLGATGLMVRMFVNPGSGFVTKNGSGASVVKLQKSSGGNDPSTYRLTLQDSDKVYKTKFGSTPTRVNVGSGGNIEVNLASEEGIHIVTKSGSGLSKDVFIKPGDDGRLTFMTQKLNDDGSSRIKEIVLKDPGNGSPRILTRTTITVNPTNGTHKSIETIISSTDPFNVTGNSRLSSR